MKTVPILFTFDKGLLMPAVVCITSLLENAAEETFYDIFIAHNASFDFSGTILDKIPEKYGNCKITYIKIEKEFIGAYEVRGIPETAYYRLVSPEFIKGYDKILYSDVDVIFREDLGKYYDVDLVDNYFAAVDNCSALRPEVQERLKNDLNLDYRKGYFYSGNLIINCAQILKDGITDEFRRLGKNEYNQQDMDIMNIACNGRILPLGPSYCLTNFLYSLIVNRRDEMVAIYGKEEINHALKSGIVHYNGAKPWNGPCLNMDIWWEYYRKSLCFDEQFCFEFWNKQFTMLESLPMSKRIKMVLRYPLDRKHIKQK